MWYEKVLFPTHFAFAAFLVGAVVLPRLSLKSKTIWIIVLTNIIIDLYATYIDVVWHKTTHSLYNIFTAIEYCVIMVINLHRPPSLLYKKYLLISLLFFSVLSAFIFYRYGIDVLNTYLFATGGFIVCVFSYLRIRFAIARDNIEFTDILIWFAFANITFYAGALPVLLLAPIILNIPTDLANDLMLAKDVAYSLWSVFIITGFLCLKKKTI